MAKVLLIGNAFLIAKAFLTAKPFPTAMAEVAGPSPVLLSRPPPTVCQPGSRLFVPGNPAVNKTYQKTCLV
jgi:hypothetical protein